MENLLEITKYFLNQILNAAESHYFLTILMVASFSLKFFVLTILLKKGSRKKVDKSWFLILFVIIGSLMSDSAWIIVLIRRLFFANIIPYKISLLWTRISWIFYIIQYQCLAIFIENLADKNNKTKIHQKFFVAISSLFIAFFIVIIFYNFNCNSYQEQIWLETKIQTFSMFYMIFPLMLTALILTSWKKRKIKIPRILNGQLKILIKFIVCPILISDFIQYYPKLMPAEPANTYSAVGLSAILTTYAIFYCIRKIMGLRFLNLDDQVKATKRFEFINDFKNTINQLAEVTSLTELKFITQNFFQDAFDISHRRVHLHIRNLKNPDNTNEANTINNDEKKVEAFIGQYGANTDVGALLTRSTVLIVDELEFSNFYENNTAQEIVINFIKELYADLFIPIFENKKLIAYIIVEKDARAAKNKRFYSDIEHDQMTVFATYLANIIKLFKSKNLKLLLQEKKILQEELYHKHQENNQYKESIRSFIRSTNQKQIGFIFYKSRRFSFANKAAHEFIPFNLNTYSGHPITKKLTRIAKDVLEYKSPQSCFITNEAGEKLAVLGLLNIDQNNVIISIYYPEISDVLKKNIETLKDPTKMDYLLYLETTKSGKLINKLIPGNSELLLRIKTDLLKASLSKKAILLDLPEEDLVPTVEVLHHISLREKLHILDLKHPSCNTDTAIKLFGISEIFGFSGDQKPLLEKLDSIGTIFIKNIENLELEAQQHLAEFIRFGVFRQFKGDKKTPSDVRIICSANKELKQLVAEKTFSSELFKELQRSSLYVPSLMTIPEADILSVTDTFAQQATKKTDLHHILELTETEKNRIAQSKPNSFFELKKKVQQILEKKSEESSIVEEMQLISSESIDITDPHILEAARLGKHALRDKKIMIMLWDKFQNQNKIAALLGVNRSSVNRRCKEYNLL